MSELLFSTATAEGAVTFGELFQSDAQQQTYALARGALLQLHGVNTGAGSTGRNSAEAILPGADGEPLDEPSMFVAETEQAQADVAAERTPDLSGLRSETADTSAPSSRSWYDRLTTSGHRRVALLATAVSFGGVVSAAAARTTEQLDNIKLAFQLSEPVQPDVTSVSVLSHASCPVKSGPRRAIIDHKYPLVQRGEKSTDGPYTTARTFDIRFTKPGPAKIVYDIPAAGYHQVTNVNPTDCGEMGITVRTKTLRLSGGTSVPVPLAEPSSQYAGIEQFEIRAGGRNLIFKDGRRDIERIHRGFRVIPRAIGVTTNTDASGVNTSPVQAGESSASTVAPPPAPGS